MRYGLSGCLLVVAAALLAQDPAAQKTRSAASAQILAGQVVADLRNVQANLNGIPDGLRQPLQRKCDECMGQAVSLQRSIAAFQPHPTLVAQFQQLDGGTDGIVAAARQMAPNDLRLQSAAARLDVTTNRLGAALNFGVGMPPGGGFPPPLPGGGWTDPQRQALRRMARSLDSQSQTLYAIARNALPEDRFGQQLEEGICQFARSADRVSDLLNGNAGIDQVRGEFAGVQTRWAALAQVLGGVGLAAYPQLRLQAAQVDQSFRTLAAALGVIQPPLPGPGPIIPPGPGFPIGNPRQEGIIAFGAGHQGQPIVRVFLDRGGQNHFDFMAYDASFQGGVRVAVGDVNGDGIVDVITAPGQGGQPLVRVFDGRDFSLINQFMAYDPRMLSGVWVAAADITLNGRAEIVTGASDGGGPHVRVFDGLMGQLKTEFFAYDQRLSCGARVAVADVDGDRVPDIITAPGPNAEPVVRVFSGRGLQPLAAFYAYERAFVGGVFVAAADVTGNGRAEIVTGAGLNGGPHVRIFEALTGNVLNEFFAYDRNFLGGVRVALFDVDRARRPTVLTAPGSGAPPLVRLFDSRTGQVVREFMAYDERFTGGAFVAGN